MKVNYSFTAERQEIMSNQYYEMYIDEIKSIPACTEEEIRELLARMEDRAVRSRLAEGSLRCVVEAAQEYADQGVELSDLVQEGNMALMLMLSHYQDSAAQDDENPVARFLRLRDIAVNTAMKQLVEEQRRSSKTQEKLAASINVLNVVTTKLAEELGRQATLQEIAEKMQMTEDEVYTLMQTAINAVSVDRAEAAASVQEEER